MFVETWMKPLGFAVLGKFIASSAATSPPESASSGLIKPTRINLQERVPRMLSLIKETKLPKKPAISGIKAPVGIDLEVLRRLQQEWVHDFDWTAEEANINRYHHFTTNIEDLNIHFLHETSDDPEAIPLLLLHGWPGSFLEFLPLVDPLRETAKTSDGKSVSFHLVIPSLPGFLFSDAPPANWTVADTARIFNKLMTDVLKYDTFALHGTDWGSSIGYSMYDQFNLTTRAFHTPFLPFLPLTSEELAARNISLTPEEEFQAHRTEEFLTTGMGSLDEQVTKPNTIGLALQDNPIGQLAWMGEKMIDWSDPSAGTEPSVLDNKEILRSISLYYLTKSFTSSVYIYYMNPVVLRPDYTKAKTDAPLLFSSFKYQVGFWHPSLIKEVGNLVYYKYHEFGGHFPGIDNPPALVEDIREIGNYWA